MYKKIISVFIVFTILTMVACNSKTVTDKPQKENQKTNQKDVSSINLLYNKADSFNPYTAVTENNRNLCSLIFEPLVKTDGNINPVLRLASDVKLEGSKCYVTIKDARFSDGTSVTADDIVYSYNIAKNYGGLYSTHLYEVTSLSVSSSKSVIINLSRNDPYFINLLDFPILKSGSDKITNSDGVILPPVGCGRYTISDDKTKLLLNETFFGDKGAIKEINLINAPDEDSISHYIEVGATIAYYADMSNGNIIRMSGKKTDVMLNNLMYIGINLKSSGLSNKYLRYAISSAIDRENICSKCYFDSAKPATGYFNPCIDEVKAVQSIKTSADTQITIENLNKLGYNSKDNDGYYVDNKGKRISLRLLVNKENRLRVTTANRIANDLKSAGIEIKVIETSYADYLNCLTTNSFDLYLGEISVLPNFDMSSLVIPGGSVAYGITEKQEESKEDSVEKSEETNATAKTPTDTVQEDFSKPIKDVISNFYNSTSSLSDVAGTLLTEMVQIPILYRQGLFFYKDNIISGVQSTEGDIYYSIEEYVIE